MKRLNKKKLLYIKDELINSMTSNGVKDSISSLLHRLENGRTDAKYVNNRIAYYIRMDYSEIKDFDMLENIYDRKVYYLNNELSDEYEDKIQNTYSW
jgi:hypothetical protein|tara:strand:- start:3800 stop:4090 length:291 start_codon:yes stop_codon:yes gene_type:complete